MSVTCSICINGFGDEDNRDIVAIKCGHAFHRKCLLEWKNSSKNTTCPECRTKYTVRAVSKLFLNIVPKDQDESFQTFELYGEIQTHKKQAESLQKDRDKLALEKQQMEFELLKSRDEYQRELYKNQGLKMDYDIKCQAYSLISVVNDEYLTTNDSLRDENLQLKQQIVNLKQELQDVRVQRLKTSKPFVDLTNDDNSDSDIEIIEDETVPAAKTEDNKPSVVLGSTIELNDEAEIEPEIAQDVDNKTDMPSISPQNDDCLKLHAANDSWSVANEFSFLLDQI